MQQLAQQGDGSAPHGRTLPHQVADQQFDREEFSIGAGSFVSKESVFNSSKHWSAMLKDIKGLRSAIIPSDVTPVGDDIFEYE